ncbi:DNA sulfur modification protein DndD [Bacillus cereus]|uniref:Nuclease SbcCD subunit C n=1 Tax=Bacillus cereus TaxID=1396 RepID=A0A2B0LQ74_BACCE|nr:DNA sulfur modification protein DndD [Bacillus cereus]
MLFQYLRFQNYRPYYGDQTIYFQSKEANDSPYRRNIVLVGGLNGAGKTSLINSIHICFYGRRKFAKKEYDEIRQNAINTTYRSEGGIESSIELGIRDHTGSYAIKVQFTYDERKDEVFEARNIYMLSEQGEIVREIVNSEQEFNDFVDQRIPIDVAPFFIFDAEKIRDLVGEHDKKETIDAIQKIVSLELYNKLLQDLNHISDTDTRNLSKLVKDEEIQAIIEELTAVTEEYDEKKSLEEALSIQIKDLEDEKQVVERERRKKIAENSRTKQQINRVIGNKEQELAAIKVKIERFGGETLPNYILLPLINDLKKRLNKEKEYINAKEREKSAFSSYDNFMHKVLKTDLFPPLLPNQKKKLYTNGKEIWAQLNKIQQTLISEELEILHDISPGDYNKLISHNMNSSNIKQLFDQQYKIQEELEKLNRELGDAPEEINTVEFDDNLHQISEHLGSLRKDRSNLGKDLVRLRDRRTNLRNEMSRKQELKKDLGPIEQKIELLNLYISGTQEFIEKVTVLKASQLKVEIETILRSLFRKSDFAEIQFSPADYTLRIFNEFGKEIDLMSRSEGEKQLIALSMIWALTKVSGVDVPFVIDTPLARLDSVHRRNIVDYYFTNLSDQVIILSTDTEITEDFAETIEPFVEKSYLLEYDDEEKVTKIKEGYFQFSKVM